MTVCKLKTSGELDVAMEVGRRRL